MKNNKLKKVIAGILMISVFYSFIVQNVSASIDVRVDRILFDPDGTDDGFLKKAILYDTGSNKMHVKTFEEVGTFEIKKSDVTAISFHETDYIIILNQKIPGNFYLSDTWDMDWIRLYDGSSILYQYSSNERFQHDSAYQAICVYEVHRGYIQGVDDNYRNNIRDKTYTVSEPRYNYQTGQWYFTSVSYKPYEVFRDSFTSAYLGTSYTKTIGPYTVSYKGLQQVFIDCEP